MSDYLRPHGLYSPWNSPGQNTEVGSLSLLQGIFPTQGSNQGLLHFRWILYQLNYQGSPYVFTPIFKNKRNHKNNHGEYSYNLLLLLTRFSHVRLCATP